MTDELFHIGITHKTAPAEVRGRFQIDVERQRALLDALADVAAERAVLSTCGRFEVYAVVSTGLLGSGCNGDSRRAGDVRRGRRPPAHAPGCSGLLGRVLRELSAEDVPAQWFVEMSDEACAKHLLRVSAGLESQVIGEPQILTQTRAAFATGDLAGSIGPVLSALFRTAIHAGRCVRRDTGINPGRRSFARLAVDRVERECGPLPSQNVAVVGGGGTARDVSAELAARRTGSVVIVNRGIERAREVAETARGIAMGLDDLPSALSRADSAIVCTGAPHFVVDDSSFQRRSGGRLFIVDLSMPRNVDPAVDGCAGVSLVHLDGLCGGGVDVADDLIAAERIVELECERFRRWRRGREAAPLIRSLLRSAQHDERGAETDRACRRSLYRPIVRLVESCAA